MLLSATKWLPLASLYKNFVGEAKSSLNMVKDAFNVKLGKVTKSDLMELCPSLSRSTVEKALRNLISIDYISKHGNGPATYYLLK